MVPANDSSKRRRLISEASPGVRRISDLPNAVLTHVANYIAPPSRALFAVALSGQNEAAASDERNTAIVGDEWSTLDFGDIEIDLVSRLSDNDISSVLLCIDAANKLKTLKLTNCFSITGIGLQPLRGSTKIEQIDLSLVAKHHSPDLVLDPPISCDHVLPILDSIIEREGCSLRHLQFPSAWRRRRRELRIGTTPFQQFLERYGAVLLNRNVVSCLKCNRNIPFEYDESWISYNGIQNYTCCECLKYYCEECDTDDTNSVYMFNFCRMCERKFCADCQSMKYCCHCEVREYAPYYCVDCTDFTECSANLCSAIFCEGCVVRISKKCCKCDGIFCGDGDTCTQQIRSCSSCKKYCCGGCDLAYGWIHCEKCSNYYCEDCKVKKGVDAVQYCESCKMEYCGECLLSRCQWDWFHIPTDCAGCIKIAGPFLVEENKKVRKENEEAKAEIEELKYQLRYQEGRVKAENNELKERVIEMQDHIQLQRDQLQCLKEKVKELEEEKIKQNSKSGDDE